MVHRNIAPALVCGLALAVPAAASEVFYYPSKGQSAEQLEKDKFECYGWATGETGFDPSSPPPTPKASAATEAAEDAKKGSAVRGAARGAAVGAIGGAIAGDAGKGAAVGAGVGAAGGRIRANRNAQEARSQDQATQNASMQEYNEKRTSWQRAVNACMGGRGYTVN